MAQLAAVEKGLYYPTPVEVVARFVKDHLSYNRYAHASYFDPCAGEGLALKAFADAFDLHPSYRKNVYGIELEGGRAEELQKNIEFGYRGAYESFSVTGIPTYIFMNPPYDEVGGKRIELDWIRQVAMLMVEGANVLIAVLPDRFFKGGDDETKFMDALRKSDLSLCPMTGGVSGALRFPDGEFEAFKQVVVALRKKRDAWPRVPVEIVGEIGKCNYKYSNTITIQNNNKTSSLFIVPFLGVEYGSMWKSEDYMYKVFGEITGDMPVVPLMPMRDEIMAAVIAGGAMSGVQVGNTLIRGGSTIINEVSSDSESEDGLSKTVTLTPRLLAKISQLNLETGDILTFDSESPEFGAQIKDVAMKVKSYIEVNNPPVFRKEKDLDRLAPLFSKVRSPKMDSESLLPTQVTAASVIIRAWEEDKSALLNGEMGVGKTITATAAAVGYVLPKKRDAQKIMIFLPAKDDLVLKWREEIEAACRDIPHTVFDIETIKETQRAFANDGLTFILVKESMVKRTSGIERLNMMKKCFHCGAQSSLVNIDGDLPEKADEVVYCSSCKVKYETRVRTGRGKGNVMSPKDWVEAYYPGYKPDANNPMTKKELTNLIASVVPTTTRGNSGNAYSSIAQYIAKHYSHSYVLIVDEAHQVKGGESARGYASASLIKGAKHVLLMTGTFYNGYASSMFYNMYRASGAFRKQHAFTGVSEFVRMYGLEEVTYATQRRSISASWSGYKKRVLRKKEIPGIHPAMIASMLPLTIFMKLSDMDTVLPPNTCHTLFVDPEPEAWSAVKAWLEKVKAKALMFRSDRSFKHIGSSIFAQWVWARRSAIDVFPDGDEISWEIAKDKVESLRMGANSAWTAKNKFLPKEDVALRIIAEGKKNGYPTLIYYSQPDRRPTQHRLISLANMHGMKIVYMPATVSARKPFIEKALKDGADAVFCNANLVREGIDLLQFRQIIWFDATPDAILVNQANARIHRIGKKHPTKVYYLAYNETYQAKQWQITADKVTAMNAAHGDVHAGLASLLGTKTLIVEIQDEMIHYEKMESDLSANDFPPLGTFSIMEKVEVPEASFEDLMSTWRKKTGGMKPTLSAPKPKTEAPQLKLFG